MYKIFYSETFIKKIKKLKKKDYSHYTLLMNKIDEIKKNPKKRYKFLKYSFKKINRIHINSYVLIFIIEHKTKTISFEDYDHHDKIYKKRD